MTVLHFFLPALAFGLVAKTTVDRSFIGVPLTAAFVTVCALVAGFAVYELVPRFNTIEPSAFGVMVLAAGFGNVTYLGLPVISKMLGMQYGYAAILYDLLASSPVLLTVGVFIAARYGSGESVSFARSVKQVLGLPPLWAVAAAVLVNLTGVRVPKLVLETVSLMGSAVIPVMIFTVGLALDFRDIKRLPIAVPALGLKLIVSPVLAVWMGFKIGLTTALLKAVTIEAAMPVMVLSLVIADEFQLDVPLAAVCIAVSSAALFFTMPLMMKMLF